MNQPTETRSAYCRCGATFHGSSRPPDAVRFVLAKFRELHSGEGHGPATQAAAARARRKADEMALREESS